MNWDTDLLGSFLATLVGGVTALAGVAMTQRSQRRNAHADRIWAERMSAYGALYEMLEADLRLLRAAPGERLPEGSREVLDRPLPRTQTRQLFLFASRPVLSGYREYYNAVADLLGADESGANLTPRLTNAISKGERLQHLISSETRGD